MVHREGNLRVCLQLVARALDLVLQSLQLVNNYILIFLNILEAFVD